VCNECCGKMLIPERYGRIFFRNFRVGIFLIIFSQMENADRLARICYTLSALNFSCFSSCIESWEAYSRLLLTKDIFMNSFKL
jgi:hypothetical protein